MKVDQGNERRTGTLKRQTVKLQIPRKTQDKKFVKVVGPGKMPVHFRGIRLRYDTMPRATTFGTDRSKVTLVAI